VIFLLNPRIFLQLFLMILHSPDGSFSESAEWTLVTLKIFKIASKKANHVYNELIVLFL